MTRHSRSPHRTALWTSARLRVLVGATQLLTASISPALAQLAPNARPTGGAVVAGQASISHTTSTTTVNQTTARGVVNWQSFDIGSAQSVQFQQPSASAVTLLDGSE